MIQFIFLQEGVSGFYQKTKIHLVLKSHELFSTKYTTQQFACFIYYSHQDKLKNSRTTRIHLVHPKLSTKQA